MLTTVLNAVQHSLWFALPGILAGLVPVTVGIAKKHAKLGIVGFFSCIVAELINEIVLNSMKSTDRRMLVILPILTAIGFVLLITKDKEGKTEKSVMSFLENNAIIVLMLLVAVVVGVLRPTFATTANLKNLAMNTSIRFIIALGVSGCLITKGTDLSAGRVVGLAACLAASLLQKADYKDKVFPNLGQMSIVVVVFIVLAVGGLIGATNGSIIAFLHVPPFLASLGMQTLIYGICLVFTGAKPIGGLRSDYTEIATGGFFGGRIPYLFVIALLLGLFMWFLYNETRYGKYMYAIGGNENAAEVSGVNTTKMKVLIYMLAGVLYAVAGFLMAAKAGGASVNTGMGYELEAIAACTIGGVSTNGGVGRVSGILVGVMVFELLKISLQFMGVKSDYTYIVQGLVIIIAVALDLRKYLAKK